MRMEKSEHPKDKFSENGGETMVIYIPWDQIRKTSPFLNESKLDGMAEWNKPWVNKPWANAHNFTLLWISVCLKKNDFLMDVNPFTLKGWDLDIASKFLKMGIYNYSI